MYIFEHMPASDDNLLFSSIDILVLEFSNTFYGHGRKQYKEAYAIPCDVCNNMVPTMVPEVTQRKSKPLRLSEDG